MIVDYLRAYWPCRALPASGSSSGRRQRRQGHHVAASPPPLGVGVGCGAGRAGRLLIAGSKRGLPGGGSIAHTIMRVIVVVDRDGRRELVELSGDTDAAARKRALPHSSITCPYQEGVKRGSRGGQEGVKRGFNGQVQTPVSLRT
eukprot:1188095-Prorocentrum_minimum.AAC.1